MAPLVVVAAAAAPVEVALKTEDGVALVATYHKSAGAPAAALVLMPMLGGARKDWEPFAIKAAASGIDVLMVDPRGHGDSPNPYGQRPGDWDKARWREVDRDPGAAVAWLEGRGFSLSSIFLGGASIGASLAFRRAASDPRLGGAVLISPGDNPKRVPVSEFAANYGRRPLFVASAADDSDFDAIAGRLASSVAGPVERLRLPAGGHGTDILSHPVSGPALTAGLIDWMAKTAGAAR
ncbi:MAG: alpha/beta hydrolase [Elusimicrobiota bacterium]|nr:alpha/beta hydrolase [Elusimicrobiota bacterium]